VVFTVANQSRLAGVQCELLLGLTLLGEYLLFLILWGAIGLVALISGVMVIVSMGRQMEEPDTPPGQASSEPEDVLAA
jgi:hypothetical protein